MTERRRFCSAATLGEVTTAAMNGWCPRPRTLSSSPSLPSYIFRLFFLTAVADNPLSRPFVSMINYSLCFLRLNLFLVGRNRKGLDSANYLSLFDLCVLSFQALTHNVDRRRTRDVIADKTALRSLAFALPELFAADHIKANRIRIFVVA